MATSQGLPVTGDSDEGLRSLPGSISSSSTYSILNLLPAGPDIREIFLQLITQLEHERQELSPSDRMKWQNNRKHLARLICNHTTRPSQMRQDTSYEARFVGERKVVFIGCKTKDAKNEVKGVLGDSGAIDFVRGILEFDDIHVDMKFKGHLSEAVNPSVTFDQRRDYTKGAMLGMPFNVPALEGEFPNPSHGSTTLGGAILVGGKPFALATGCPFARRASTRWDGSEVVMHSYSGFENLWTPSEAQQLIRDRNERCVFSPTPDWALVALSKHMIPPNTMISVEEIDNWPWPSQAIQLGLFVEDVVNEQDLAPLLRGEGNRFACLTFSKTSSVPLPGSISPGTSAIVLDNTMFTVLRIDMLSPLEYGDSGSWVVVGNKVCGIIIAGSGRPDKMLQDDELSPKVEVFSAYMLPIKDVLETVSQTLDLEVSLPTLADYRIDFLRRNSGRWSLSTLPCRPLEMEFLLCQQKHARRGGKPEAFDLAVESRNTTVGLPLPQKLSWPTSSILGPSIGLHYETIHHLLQLGDVCPLSETFRLGLRRWARDYRKSRWHNRRTFVCAAITNQCLQTEAGENLLGLVIFLWKAQRKRVPGFKRDRDDKKPRIAWLSQLLSALFSIMATPKSTAPSVQQLRAFTYCIVSGFKDKDLKHLYLVFDAGVRVESAAPTSESWLTAPPPRISSLSSLWRSFKGWASGNNDQLYLIDLDTAVDAYVSTTWTNSVTTTTRILTLLQKIYESDKTQVLVYCGQDASWIATYAAVVLGLAVNCRDIDPNGARFWHPEGMAEDQILLSPRVDVVVYFGEQIPTSTMCEIVDRIDVGQGGVCSLRVWTS